MKKNIDIAYKNTFVVKQKDIWIAYLRGRFGNCPIYIGPYKKYAVDAAKNRDNDEKLI